MREQRFESRLEKVKSFVANRLDLVFEFDRVAISLFFAFSVCHFENDSNCPRRIEFTPHIRDCLSDTIA